MKKSFFSFIFGFMLGIMILGAITVYAVDSFMIEVYYNIKDIVINKVSKMPKDDKPFVHNNRTYVPLRFIAEELGYPVDWDYETGSVLIGEFENPKSYYPGEKPNGVDYMNYQEGHSFHSFRYGYNTSIKTDNVGKEFDSYILLYIDDIANINDAWNYIEFPLNNKFKSFKANLGMTGEYQNTKDIVTLEIYADEVLIYESSVKAGDIPKEITLDISEKDKIGFKMITTGKSDSQIGLFDAHFLK